MVAPGALASTLARGFSRFKENKTGSLDIILWLSTDKYFVNSDPDLRVWLQDNHDLLDLVVVEPPSPMAVPDYLGQEKRVLVARLGDTGDRKHGDQSGDGTDDAPSDVDESISPNVSALEGECDQLREACAMDAGVQSANDLLAALHFIMLEAPAQLQMVR